MEKVRFFVKNGADLNIAIGGLRLFLHVFIDHILRDSSNEDRNFNALPMVIAKLKGKDPALIDRTFLGERITALAYVIKNGNNYREEQKFERVQKIVDLLIEQGADVDKAKVNDKHLLFYFMGQSKADTPWGKGLAWFDAFKKVLAKAKEFDAPGAEGQTPLQWAASHYNHDLIGRAMIDLVDRGANVDIEVEKEPLLHYLLSKRELRWATLFKAVLHKTTKVEDIPALLNSKGETLFISAIQQVDDEGQVPIIYDLIECKADLKVTVGGDLLPHFLLKNRNFFSIDLFKKVFESDVYNDPELKDSAGKTLLTVAIEFYRPKTAAYLLEKGANSDIQLKNEQHQGKPQSPLSWYLPHEESFELFKALLVAKSSPAVIQREGAALLEKAVSLRSVEHSTRVMIALIEAGADVDIYLNHKWQVYLELSNTWADREERKPLVHYFLDISSREQRPDADRRKILEAVFTKHPDKVNTLFNEKTPLARSFEKIPDRPDYFAFVDAEFLLKHNATTKGIYLLHHCIEKIRQDEGWLKFFNALMQTTQVDKEELRFGQSPLAYALSRIGSNVTEGTRELDVYNDRSDSRIIGLCQRLIAAGANLNQPIDATGNYRNRDKTIRQWLEERPFFVTKRLGITLPAMPGQNTEQEKQQQ